MSGFRSNTGIRTPTEIHSDKRYIGSGLDWKAGPESRILLPGFHFPHFSKDSPMKLKVVIVLSVIAVAIAPLTASAQQAPA